MSAPGDLAATLASVTEPEYVRFVADWLTDPDSLDQEPAPHGELIDALVAASAAHAAFVRGLPVPGWTNADRYQLATFWYPGPDALLPNALVHAPLSFAVRGVLIEADSLESV